VSAAPEQLGITSTSLNPSTFASSQEPKRVHAVDALRGLAAVAVAIFHFTHGDLKFPPHDIVRLIGMYGWAGVDVFFVISGFVLPYSLSRSGYRVENYFIFLVRRVIRLDPPYLASVVLVVFLDWASSFAPGYRGHPFVIEWPRLLLHVGYLNGFARLPWYIDVYWTLAIELQFYLIVGLFIPLLVSRRAHVGTAGMVVLAFSGLVFRNLLFLPAWIFPFLMGMIVFRFRTGLLSHRFFIIQVVLASAGVAVTLGTAPFVGAVIAAAAIAYLPSRTNRALELLGAISYSLYLLHVPIGERVINLFSRLDLGALGRVGAVFAAFAASMAASVLLYRFVELPAQRWARRFTWQRPVGE
jgi:peptidoglycan/LPS O-acetylase OafA/YrhL